MRITAAFTAEIKAAEGAGDVSLALDLVDEETVLILEVLVAPAAVFMVGGVGLVLLHLPLRGEEAEAPGIGALHADAGTRLRHLGDGSMVFNDSQEDGEMYAFWDRIRDEESPVGGTGDRAGGWSRGMKAGGDKMRRKRTHSLVSRGFAGKSEYNAGRRQVSAAEDRANGANGKRRAVPFLSIIWYIPNAEP